MTTTDLILPRESLASRNVPVSSKGSCIGDLLVGDPDGHERQLRAESWLERQFVRIFSYTPGVVHVAEQPPVVDYLDEDGRARSHTFDLRITYADGSRIVCAIKPHEIAIKRDLWTLVARIAAYMPPSVADAAVVLTEQKIDRVALRNAEVMHACRLGDPADDEVVLAAARSLVGAVPLATLVELAGIGGRGFRAAVRLLAAGRLRMLVHERISDNTLVAVSEETR